MTGPAPSNTSTPRLCALLALGLGSACGSSELDSRPGVEGSQARVDVDGDGWTVAEGDCDDHDAEVNPDEAESIPGDRFADDIDNDCDGVVDDHTERYDDDGDGWSEAAGDCDDDDPEVSPSAVEQPDTPLDENCDGSLVVTRAIADAAVAIWWGDNSNTVIGNAAGSGVGFAGDVDGDGTPDVLVSAPGGRREGGQPAAYLLAGPAAGGGSLAAGALATFERSPSSDWFVFRNTRSAGDVNGDGFSDVLLSDERVAGVSPQGSTLVDAGRVALFFGPVTGVRAILSADVLITGASSDELVGRGLAAGSDLDGDGLADIVMSGGGGFVVFRGPLAGELTTSDADVTIAGGDSPVELGGDTDGDGHPDLLVGDDSYDHDKGRVFVVAGPFTADAALESVSTSLTGEDKRDFLGRAVSSAGDVDADGFDDVLVGAPADGESGGRAYLVLGPIRGSTAVATRAETRWSAESDGVFLGTGLAPAGDMDLDGFGGVLIGAPGKYYGDARTEVLVPGKVYVSTGQPAGEVSAGEASTVLVGSGFTDGTGYSVAGGVDLDGDEVPDMLVGAPFDAEHGTETGKVYVLSGAHLSGVPTRP